MNFVFYSFLWHVVITAIFVLCIISGIISYHSKEKSFGYYALYSFSLLVFLFFKAPYKVDFIAAIYQSRFTSLNWYVQVIYNCSYFVFFLHFLDLKEHYIRFYEFIKRVVVSVFLVSSLIFIGALLLNRPTMYRFFFVYIFTPVMVGFGVYTVVKAFMLPGKLKFFITFGCITYIALAITALVLSIFPIPNAKMEPLNYFYIGIFIEQLALALGLAYKVKVINRNFLLQVSENEKIKRNQNKMLEKKLQEKEDELLALTTKAEKQKIAQIKSEHENELYQLNLTSLRSQMNPHFIFNALNSIKVFLIDKETVQAVYYLNKFAKLIRKILESSRISNVSLSEELDIINLYFSIENMRFEGQIDFVVDVNQNINLANIKVPPLFLQPFVENSLWHGLTLSNKKEKTIEIKIYSENNIPILSIKDNGVGRKFSKEKKSKKIFKKKSIGLKMTKERLKYFNNKEGVDYSFSIIDHQDKNQNALGTEVIFRLHK